METVSDEERQAILEEYKALRAEIIALIQARNQFQIYDIIAFGALFAAAVQFHNVFFLVAPLIHYPFMFYWAYADRQIINIGHYIKDSIEPRVSGLYWERSMFAIRLELWEEAAYPKIGKYIPIFLPAELSGLSTFVGTTIISLVAYASGISVGEKQTPVDNLTTGFLVILNLIILGHSYLLIRKSLYDFRKYLQREYWYYPDKGKPADYQKRLKEHNYPLRCSEPDCKVHSHEPVEEPLQTHIKTAPKIVKVHWDTPKGFKRCSECGQWFCQLHWHLFSLEGKDKFFCDDCARKRRFIH